MTPIESFRVLTKALRNLPIDDDNNTHMLDVPPDIKDLFRTFVKEATHDELVDALCILSNMDSHDWDLLAHMFL